MSCGICGLFIISILVSPTTLFSLSMYMHTKPSPTVYSEQSESLVGWFLEKLISVHCTCMYICTRSWMSHTIPTALTQRHTKAFALAQTHTNHPSSPLGTCVLLMSQHTIHQSLLHYLNTHKPFSLAFTVILCAAMITFIIVPQLYQRQ